MTTEQETHTWPELAYGLFEKLTDSNAEISYHFDKLNVHIPASTSDQAPSAPWILDGTLKITTSRS